MRLHIDFTNLRVISICTYIRGINVCLTYLLLLPGITFLRRDVRLFAKANGKEQGGCSIKPPVSKVRPLMEDGVSGNAENKSPVSPGKAQGPK